uniref:Uncharacterized protein n=1 Tax=Arundo donax TaxID=35708 RepID=A0A0A9GUA2_ARUDO
MSRPRSFNKELLLIFYSIQRGKKTFFSMRWTRDSDN